MLSDIGIDGIYVVHAKNGYETHEKRIIDLFAANKLDFEFVTDGDPSVTTNDQLNGYFTDGMLKGWSAGVVSCTLNHLNAYERMVKNNNRYALVFENDPFFLGDFNKNLRRLSDEMHNLERGFIISIENTSLRNPSYWATRRGKYLYRATHGRCAGAYIIDLEGAKNILNDVKTNKCPIVIDWYHNFLIRDRVIKMYWAYPTFVEQGSHNGQLCSTISSKEKSNKRQILWFLQKNVKPFFKRFFNDKYIY